MVLFSASVTERSEGSEYRGGDWDSMADQNDIDLDSIIDRLLEVRGSRPGKQVQLHLETEIRYLCTKSREIFNSQPILLKLEAPIKVRACVSGSGEDILLAQICGDIHGQHYNLSLLTPTTYDTRARSFCCQAGRRASASGFQHDHARMFEGSGAALFAGIDVHLLNRRRRRLTHTNTHFDYTLLGVQVRLPA
jgi:hypothetical protein